ncbi:DNA helicase RecG, partial [bacterium CG17_big_fil_post_rev_8_21_14_2_50_64_8]
MTAGVDLTTQVQFLRSVGPARARALARLGVVTVGDLLAHYPRRYFDRTSCQAMNGLAAGKEATVQGEVLTCGQRRTRGGRSLQTVTIGDDTGVVFCVWFNQPHILKAFRAGLRVMASGMPQRHQGRWQLVHPDYELLTGPGSDADAEADGGTAHLHTGRMVPVYGLTAGIGQHWLRALVNQAIERTGPGLSESLPPGLMRRRGLLGRAEALRQIHFPADAAVLEQARRRLVYEELFLVQVLMAVRRLSRQKEAGLRLDKPGDLTRRLVEALPFTLTGAQRRVLAEILADMRSGRAMHRLLQGDVGSGKTLVAFIAALFVIEQGHQALLLAPTEVLARQHGHTLRHLAEPLQVNVETLTGSTPAAERRAILRGAAAGEIDLLVGTHAVIGENVLLPRLGLSIVDEQHRFGVQQRGRSAAAGTGPLPHLLVMSATPIPRSLALTLYGDLDLSLIDELPAGRRPITTTRVDAKGEQGMWEGCRR